MPLILRKGPGDGWMSSVQHVQVRFPASPETRRRGQGIQGHCTKKKKEQRPKKKKLTSIVSISPPKEHRQPSKTPSLTLFDARCLAWLSHECRDQGEMSSQCLDTKPQHVSRRANSVGGQTDTCASVGNLVRLLQYPGSLSCSTHACRQKSCLLYTPYWYQCLCCYGIACVLELHIRACKYTLVDARHPTQ
jgi:hypothetical protein